MKPINPANVLILLVNEFDDHTPSAVTKEDIDNIIKLQSLVHNQFSAERFVEFIRYSWFASGYLEERGDRFSNPVEVLFPR